MLRFKFLLPVIPAILLSLMTGCAEKTRTLIQYKEIKTTCPVLKVQKTNIPNFKFKTKILKINENIYVAIKKEDFLKLVENYKLCKEDLNNTYNEIYFFNNKIKNLNKK